MVSGFPPTMTRWPFGYWIFHIHCLPMILISGASFGGWTVLSYTHAPQTKNVRKIRSGITVHERVPAGATRGCAG